MKRKRNGKQMAPDDPRRKNLITPAKKGEVRNPTGKNGSDRIKAFHDFADMLVKIGKGKKKVSGTRIDLVRLAVFENALLGDAQTQKLFLEQYQGRARQHVEVTGPGGLPLGGPSVKLYLPSNGRDVEAKPEPAAPAGDPPDDGTDDGSSDRG